VAESEEGFWWHGLMQAAYYLQVQQLGRLNAQKRGHLVEGCPVWYIENGPGFGDRLWGTGGVWGRSGLRGGVLFRAGQWRVPRERLRHELEQESYVH
jgi:hypothetical protein